MVRRIARHLLLIALLFSIGGHWVVLQSAAWTGMLVKYATQGTTIGEAVSKTFDGQHPCKLCKVVEKGTQSDATPAKRAPRSRTELLKKITLFAEQDSPGWMPGFQWLPVVSEQEPECVTLATPPALQPPRVVA